MTHPADDTPNKLLNAATTAFLEHGYHGASVRDITHRAGVNIAAVNYHFKDKAGLYQAVVKRQFDAMVSLAGDQNAADCPLEELLETLYRTFLSALKESNACVFHQLMAREETSPSGVMTGFWVDVVKPRQDVLTQRLAEATGLPVHTLALERLTKSVIEIGKGYLRDTQALRALSPAMVDGEDWLESTCQELVYQAQDLIEGVRRRHQNNN